MMWTFLSTSLLAAAGIGVLYALHRLRSEPKRLPVATLLFYRLAATSQRSQSLWSRRFSHPKTFALLASILLALSLAVSADHWRPIGKRAEARVIVLDDAPKTDSAGRTTLERLTDAAIADLGRGPASAILAGPQPTLLGSPDEPSPLIARRLRTLASRDGVSTPLPALLMAADVLGDRPGRIDWYTSATELPPGLPPEVARAVVLHHVEPTPSVAVVGATFSPASAGRGTLRVTIAGSTGKPSSVRLVDGGSPTVVKMLTTSSGDVTFENLLADGRTITIEAADAEKPAPQSVRYQLPDHRPLTFRFAGDVPRPLRLALSTIGSESTDGRIFVAPAGTPVPREVNAAIVVVNDGPRGAKGATLEIVSDPITRGLSFEGAVAGDGPTLDGSGTPLVRADSAIYASRLDVEGRPTVRLSSAIVGADAALPRHAAFPLLLMRLSENLAKRTASDTAVAAGRLALDPLWPGPPDEPATTLLPIADRPPSPATAPTSPVAAPTAGPLPWTELLLIAAIGLLTLESALHARRRIV